MPRCVWSRASQIQANSYMKTEETWLNDFTVKPTCLNKSRNPKLLYQGITLSSTSVRRKPNAFNLVFSMQAMSRLTGKQENLEARLNWNELKLLHSRFDTVQVWNNEKELMAAMQIGKMEASAAVNLCNHIPVSIHNQLAELCKTPAALLDCQC